MRYALALFVLVYGLALGTFAIAFGSKHYAFAALRGEGPSGLLLPVPNSAVYHRYRPDFAVWYHIDDEGYRAAPTAIDPVGQVIFLGCSFTFGHGVRDDEPYPNILAHKRWRRYQVKNRALSGTGTLVAHQLLCEILDTMPLPKCVFYGYINDHQRRNSPPADEPDWRDRVRLEFSPPAMSVDGTLEMRAHFHGLPTSEDSRPDLFALNEGITLGLIHDMAIRCRKADVPFFLIVLGSHTQDPPREKFIDALQQVGVSVINTLGASDSFYPHDLHPTAEWHRAVADMLAADARLQFLSQP